jgi:hypothetical protein
MVGPALPDRPPEAVDALQVVPLGAPALTVQVSAPEGATVIVQLPAREQE